MSKKPKAQKLPKPFLSRYMLFDAIHAERERQDRKWGGPRHDDEHSKRDWIAFIVEQAADASKAVWPEEYETAMVKVAAVAVAAIESNARRVAREREADRDYQNLIQLALRASDKPAAPAEVTGDE